MYPNQTIQILKWEGDSSDWELCKMAHVLKQIYESWEKVETLVKQVF